jgi:hypothetical protein
MKHVEATGFMLLIIGIALWSGFAFDAFIMPAFAWLTNRGGIKVVKNK